MPAPLRTATRLVAVASLPPLLAIALHSSGFLLTDGEKRCYDTLDVDTPGLVCSAGFDLLCASIVLLPFHLLLVLPLVGLVRTRFRPATRRLAQLGVALASAWLLPIAGYRLLQVLPPAGEAVMLLSPPALCPALALLGLEVLRRGAPAAGGARPGPGKP